MAEVYYYSQKRKSAVFGRGHLASGNRPPQPKQRNFKGGNAPVPPHLCPEVSDGLQPKRLYAPKAAGAFQLKTTNITNHYQKRDFQKTSNTPQPFPVRNTDQKCRQRQRLICKAGLDCSFMRNCPLHTVERRNKYQILIGCKPAKHRCINHKADAERLNSDLKKNRNQNRHSQSNCRH